ncbi:hypothetical protein EXIGLDRAFT_783702 [Exidia glandulosa HHB12029]|uniref:Uncharacterized protein n=1 Tax=Exidia glandulosa HHB12029 TaxID=1314781 RepID=A0A166MX54_EXIGL|nr:hypothetical protein EXIGLDRAFT_783702 [Exidia glandulosa HHB12029]
MSRLTHGVDVDAGTKCTFSLRESTSGDVSTGRKKQAPEANWDRFIPGRVVDSRLALIPECARIIIQGGLVQYLPLHLFAPETRKAEEEARMSLAPGKSILSRVPKPNVPECKGSGC